MKQAEKIGGPKGDNISAIAVCWEESYQDHADSFVSTQTMTSEEVTTKLEEFGRQSGQKTDLSDDEIEQAISEIRSTIEKFNPGN